MFYQLIGSLGTDIIIIGEGILIAFLMIVTMQLKGLYMPLVRSRLKKENIAIIDVGGIETPIINYPRGASELKFEHQGHKYSWPIPAGIEKSFSNNSRYILASVKCGNAFYGSAKEEVEFVKHYKTYLEQPNEAYNIDKIADLLVKIRKTLSPKVQANVIDDRAKQLAEVELKNVNKPMIYGVVLGIIGIVMIGGYLIITKAMEYHLCTSAIIEIGKQVTTTTTMPILPPL